MAENRFPRPVHVRQIKGIAGELQRIVHLDRATEVEVTARVQRPTAMGVLTVA